LMEAMNVSTSELPGDSSNYTATNETIHSPTSEFNSTPTNDPKEYPTTNFVDILAEEINQTDSPYSTTQKPTVSITKQQTDSPTYKFTFNSTSVPEEYPIVNVTKEKNTTHSFNLTHSSIPTQSLIDSSFISTKLQTSAPNTATSISTTSSHWSALNTSIGSTINVSTSSLSTLDPSHKCHCTILTDELTQIDFSMAKGLYFQNRTDSEEYYGEIECWNTGNVNDMARAFENEKDFNADISCWNTASVTDMSSMFWNAQSFNVDILNWDVSNVETFSYMFYNTSSFNQNLNTWNVSKSKSFHFMFHYATSFDQSLCWNVAKASRLTYTMFDGSDGCLSDDAECCPACNPEDNYPYCEG